MVNSEMIRINELVKITSAGFIIKLHSTCKIPSVWPQVIQTFIEDLKSEISDQFQTESAEAPQDPAVLSKLLEEVKLLQHNENARAIFQIPFCSPFKSLNILMSFCMKFCDRIALGISQQQKSGVNSRVGFTASRMSLEQAFLAYASHQTQNPAD